MEWTTSAVLNAFCNIHTAPSSGSSFRCGSCHALNDAIPCERWNTTSWLIYAFFSAHRTYLRTFIFPMRVDCIRMEPNHKDLWVLEHKVARAAVVLYVYLSLCHLDVRQHKAQLYRSKPQIGTCFLTCSGLSTVMCGIACIYHHVAETT